MEKIRITRLGQFGRVKRMGEWQIYASKEKLWSKEEWGAMQEMNRCKGGDNV